MHLDILAIAVAILCAPGHAAAAPVALDAVALDAAEQKTIDQRRVVVRPIFEGEGAGGVVGVIDVDAPVPATLDAILDLPARVGEVAGLREVTIYDRAPTSIGARWRAKFLTASAIFHIRYEIDRANHQIRYALDTSRSPNDVVAAEGTYEVHAIGAKSRIVYRATSDSGRPVPRWIARWIATESLTQQLEGIRDRAEVR